MTTFSAYPDLMCGIDYCVSGYAENPSFIVFSCTGFPQVDLIRDSIITRHD